MCGLSQAGSVQPAMVLIFGGPKLTCTIGNGGKWQLGGGFDNKNWSFSGTAGLSGWQGEIDPQFDWGKVGLQGSGNYSGSDNHF